MRCATGAVGLCAGVLGDQLSAFHSREVSSNAGAWPVSAGRPRPCTSACVLSGRMVEAGEESTIAGMWVPLQVGWG